MFHSIKLNAKDCVYNLHTIVHHWSYNLKFQRSIFNRLVIKCKCLMDCQDVLYTFKTIVDC